MTVETLVSKEQIAADSDGKLNDFLAYAERIVAQFVTIVVEQSTAAEQAEEFKKTCLYGTCIGNIGCVYLGSCAGESSSTPHLRPPRFRADHLRKLVKAINITRGDPSSIDDQVRFFVSDAGKHGNEREITGCFIGEDGRSLEKSKSTFYVTFDEDIMLERHGVTSSEGTIGQMEMMHVILKAPLQLTKQPREHYPGSNLGNVIGPVKVPLFKDTWLLPKATKAKLLGAHGKILAGGAADNITLGGGKCEKPEFENNQEPMNWHSMGFEFHDEYIKSFGLKMVVYLTGLCVEALHAAIMNKIPCVAVACSEDHKNAMIRQLVKAVWAAFMDEEHPTFYQEGLVEMLGKTDEAEDGKRKNTGDDDGGDKKKPRKGKGGKGKGKAPDKEKPPPKTDSKTALLARLKALDGGQMETTETGADDGMME